MPVKILKFDQVIESVSEIKNHYYISDLHLDASDHDHAYFDRQMKASVKREDRIFIVGDLIEGILPNDKRWIAAKDIHIANLKKRAIVNMAIDYAVDRLAPYVNNIDVIMVGNHEETLYKKGFTDVTEFIIEKLNRLRNPQLRPILCGGYQCFMFFTYRYKSGPGESGGSRTYSVYATHGVGGSAEVSKDMITHNRLSSEYGVNCIISGHTHHANITPLKTLLIPSQNWSIREIERYAISLGCFKKNTDLTEDENAPYISDYADKMIRKQQDKGGVRAELTFTKAGMVAEYTIKR